MATVDINGLVFNASPWRRVTALDGWWGTPGLDAKVTATGGDGGVATAPWVLKERYVTVSGHDVGTDPVQFRRDLLAVLPANTDVPVTLTYDDGSTEQMFVRLYDALDFTIRGNQCRFTLPLVALDPHKYGASPLTADMGVFTGEAWFQELLVDTAPTPDVWYEAFTVNPISDPSFESGVGGWTSHLGSNAPARSSTHARTGTYGLTLARGAGTNDQWGKVTLANLAPNTTYTVSAYVWVPASNTNDGGLFVGGDVTVTGFTTTATRGAFARVAHTFTTTSAATPAVTLYGRGGLDGQMWLDDVMLNPGTTADTFTVGGYEVFEQEVPTGDEFPLAATLESSGDSRSERVTVEVTGPLTQGDWWVMNESTGEVLYADLGVAAGQALVFDCYTKTATLDGSSVDHLVYGDWLTLAPGINTFRLLAGTDSDGYASVTAREAYR